MIDVIITIAVCTAVFIALRIYCKRTGVFCSRKKVHKCKKSPRTDSNR